MRWATPSMSPPAISMPKASLTAIAGGAASAAGGELARGFVLISPAKAPVPKRAAMVGRPLCRASASGGIAAGKAVVGWPGTVPLAPAKALVEARAAAADTSEAAPCPLQPCYFDKWDFFADIWDCQYAMGFPGGSRPW